MAQQVGRIRGRRLQAIRREHFAEHPLCVRCEAQGIVTIAVELDHIVALTNGGEDEQGNRQGLCADCHRAKTAEDLGHRKSVTIGVDGWPVDG